MVIKLGPIGTMDASGPAAAPAPAPPAACEENASWPLVDPHGGGDLRPLLLTARRWPPSSAARATLPRLRVSSREKGDLIMLGIGGFTPLEGFMTHADWQGVCDGMQHGERACSGRSRSRCRPTQAFAGSIRTGQRDRARRSRRRRSCSRR